MTLVTDSFEIASGGGFQNWPKPAFGEQPHAVPMSAGGLAVGAADDN